MDTQDLPVTATNTSDRRVTAGMDHEVNIETKLPVALSAGRFLGLSHHLGARHAWYTCFTQCESVEIVMARHKGTGPGFDTMRIVLAMIIMGFHGSQILHGRIAADFRLSNFFPLTLSLVPLFFSLSGFLVTGSALRTRSVKKFLTNRSLRIFPALTVEVFLCAILLGPLLTALDLTTISPKRNFFHISEI